MKPTIALCLALVVMSSTAYGMANNNDGDFYEDRIDVDDDNDSVVDTQDNCPFAQNNSQINTDLDGKGDACDPDIDNDGFLNGPDKCDLVADSAQLDSDADGVGNSCDNCASKFNPYQEDFNMDGQGNVCDNDLNPTGSHIVLGQKNFLSKTTNVGNPQIQVQEGTCFVVMTNGAGDRFLSCSFVPYNLSQGGFIYDFTWRSNNTADHGFNCSSTGTNQARCSRDLNSKISAATPTPLGLNAPAQVATYGTQIYVLDRGNKRILVWNGKPSFNNSAPKFVLGSATVFALGSLDLDYMRVVGTKLIAAKSNKTQLTVWNLPISTNNQAGTTLYAPHNVGRLDSGNGKLIIANASGSGAFISIISSQRGPLTIYSSIPSTGTLSPSVTLTVPDWDRLHAFGANGQKLVTLSLPFREINWAYWHTFPTSNTPPTLTDFDSGVSMVSSAMPLVLTIDGQSTLLKGTSDWVGISNISNPNTPPVGIAGITTMYRPGSNQTGELSFDHVTDLSVSGSDLYIVDRDNNRVIIMPKPY